MADSTNYERLEIYKMFVETSQKVTANRSKENAFFVSLNGFLIGANGVIDSWLLFVFGILLNLLWLGLIDSARTLNKAKFKVIHELEEQLCYPCFKREEEEYKKDNRIDFTVLECKMPWLIIALYVVALIINYVPLKCFLLWLCTSCIGP